MKPVQRVEQQGWVCAAAALLISCSTACSSEPGGAVSAASAQTLLPRQNAGANAKKVAEEEKKPLRKEPLPLAAATEKAQVDQIVDLVRAKGTTRVLIRLEGGPLPAIEAPQYDSRAKRSDVQPQGVPGQDANGAIFKAQTRFLDKFERGDNRRVTRFKGAPYLAMDLNLSDAVKLQTWIKDVAADSAERPFRIWVEADIALKKQAVFALQSGTSVEAAALLMDFTVAAPASPGSTVILIDDRIDDKLHLLHDRVDAIQSIQAGGVVTDVPLSTSASEPANYAQYEPSHGTKLALIVARAAPNARIIALDVFGTSEDTNVDLMISALETVLNRWVADPGRRIGAVCVSIGFPDSASTGDCDCQSDPLYVGCPVLKPAIRDYVNLLAAYQIPVVIAAGNRSLYAREVFYPACLTTAVTAGGTREDGASAVRSGVSNWGPMLDLCARSVDLNMQLDSWKQTTDPAAISYFGSGSSFAVPFVGAAFSVLLDAYPEATNALIDEALRKNGYFVTSEGVSVPEIRVGAAWKWLVTPPPADSVPVDTTIVVAEPTPPEPPPGPH